MHELLDFITKNAGVISAASAALGAAIITTMPVTPPKNFAELWSWVRESLQTVTPVRGQRAPDVPVAQSPVITPVPVVVPLVSKPLSATVAQFNKK